MFEHRAPVVVIRHEDAADLGVSSGDTHHLGVSLHVAVAAPEARRIRE